MIEKLERNDEVLLSLAKSRMEEGDLTGAISVYRSITEKDAFSYEANAGLAEAFTETDHYTQAINCWYRALSSAKDDNARARAYNGLGANYYFMGRDVVSYHYFGMQIAAAGDVDFEYNDVIAEIQNSNDEDENGHSFYVAYDRDACPGERLVEKAKAYMDGGNYSEALKVLSTVEYNDDYYDKALGLIAFILLTTGEDEHAVEVAEYLRNVEPSSFIANYVLCGCYYHTGRVEDSEIAFQQLTNDGKVEDYELKMLMLCVDTERYACAEIYADKILQEDPYNLDVLFVRSVIKYNGGDYQSAIDGLKTIMLFAEDDAVRMIYDKVVIAAEGGEKTDIRCEANLKDFSTRFMIDYIKRGLPEPDKLTFDVLKKNTQYVFKCGFSEFVPSVVQLSLAMDAKAAHELITEALLDVNVSDSVKNEILKQYVSTGINIPLKCVTANLYREFTVSAYLFAGYAAKLFNQAYTEAAAAMYIIDPSKISLLKKKFSKAKNAYEKNLGQEETGNPSALAAAVIYTMKIKIVSNKALLKDMFSVSADDLDNALSLITDNVKAVEDGVSECDNHFQSEE